MTHFPPAPAEVVDIAGVQAGERTVDHGREPCRAQEESVGVGGHREPVRHPHALRRKLAIQLPEGGILPSDEGNVLEPEVFKTTNQLLHGACYGQIVCRSRRRFLRSPFADPRIYRPGFGNSASTGAARPRDPNGRGVACGWLLRSAMDRNGVGRLIPRLAVAAVIAADSCITLATVQASS